VGRKRREGVYERKRAEKRAAPDSEPAAEPIEVADDAIVASVVAEINNHGRPLEETEAERELRLLTWQLRDEANREREQREATEREARRRAEHQAEQDRQEAETRERLRQEADERARKRQAQQHPDEIQHQVDELRRRTAQQQIEWNAFKVGARRQATSQNIDQLFSEMHDIINPPRDFHGERIAELEQRAAEAEQARLDAADPMGAVLRNIGRSWWGR
jgi:hypothetical protein